MSHFQESEHPRSDSGRFTAKVRHESPVALAPRAHHLNGAIATIRESWDPSDPWGSAMNALGAVEDALSRAHGGWGSAGDGEPLADELVEDVHRGALGIADLSRAARILDRYVDAASAAGLGDELRS